jgi:hypothetical protein
VSCALGDQLGVFRRLRDLARLDGDIHLVPCRTSIVAQSKHVFFSGHPVPALVTCGARFEPPLAAPTWGVGALQIGVGVYPGAAIVRPPGALVDIDDLRDARFGRHLEDLSFAWASRQAVTAEALCVSAGSGCAILIGVGENTALLGTMAIGEHAYA